jgi:hypothetical protein
MMTPAEKHSSVCVCPACIEKDLVDQSKYVRARAIERVRALHIHCPDQFKQYANRYHTIHKRYVPTWANVLLSSAGQGVEHFTLKKYNEVIDKIVARL